MEASSDDEDEEEDEDFDPERSENWKKVCTAVHFVH